MADRFYRVALESHIGTLAVVNTFCIFGNDDYLDFSPMTAQGLADHLGAASGFLPTYRGWFTPAGTVDGIAVREILASGDTRVPDTGYHTVNLAGLRGGSGGAAPNELTLIFGIKTNAAVRSGHGYMAMPPPIYQNELSGGQWATAGNYWAQAGLWKTELGHWKTGGSSWDAGGHWGIGVYSARRRARGDAEFAFHATDFIARPDVRWRESRQS